MRFSTATVFSALVAFASAYTQPDYNKSPEGNPITSPSLQEQVQEGKPFEIKWTPTTSGKVSLVLLRGPSTNVVPIQTIVEDIDNSGSYSWTPSTSLTADTTHYGLLLVVEGTGQYQWSTQFGLKAAEGGDDAATSTVVDGTTTICPETETATPTSTPAGTIVTVIDNETTTICPETESQTAAPTTTAAPSWSTVYQSTEITTTICPETESSAPTAAPTTVPMMPSSSLSRRPIRPTTTALASSSVPVVPTGTAAVSPSATPFNGAGQNTISFGAVVAAMFAVMAF
ncbi:GPI anchored serine-threonine rich protein [Penicillium angulare]|uniref:GPI anchored serine-threonine rich protein n=1 Tax=Penicillium angulare TaxID=116970 RepID=A0A9W9FUB4_9EURO|nr:GPI anchored serine-threonine rich protein [Penicillium angulare]